MQISRNVIQRIPKGVKTVEFARSFSCQILLSNVAKMKQKLIVTVSNSPVLYDLSLPTYGDIME